MEGKVNRISTGADVDIEEFSSRFTNESDRACAVLGAAFLDSHLEDLFRRRLSTAADEVLSQRGPLGSFGARIDVASALSWIDDDTKCDLTMIRRIRNDFAHKFDHELSFADEAIASRCKQLRSSTAFFDGFEECANNSPNLSRAAVFAMRDAVSSPRWRFQLATEMIAQLLRKLDATLNQPYSGLSLIAEARKLSGNIRITINAVGKAP
jgi:DNA-binding MltR family transcriptional regulator